MKRWISGRLTPLPDEIRVDLAKSFLSSLPQAASISLTSSLGAAVLAYRSKALLDLDLAMLLALIGVYRVAILIVYRRVDTPITTIKSALWWQRLQAGGLIGQAALLGALSFNAFTNGDTAAALLALGFVVSFCGGACARLSVVPWVPIATSLLLLGPTIAGALLHSEPPIFAAGVFLIAFVAVMAEATLYLHKLVVDRLVALREASFQASHDGLTSLPNRASFHRHLASACHRKEAAGQDFAVLYLDLDRFKAVNDRLGHTAGDDVLIEVAQRLRLGIGAGDVACRLGGDEFAILAATNSQPAAVAILAKRLVEAITRPIATCNGPAEVGVSIGIAHSDAHTAAGESILTAADQAMYNTKSKNQQQRQFTPREQQTAQAA